MTDHTEDKRRGRIYWRYANSHPVITFLLITFAWSWTFWLAVIPIFARNRSLFMVITFVGGYGPAIGGILTLSLRNGLTTGFSRRRTIAFACAAAIIFMVLLLRYLAGSVPYYDKLPDNPPLSFLVIALALVVCLIGAWVISSAYSGQSQVRERMASLLPSSSSLGWLAFAILFSPALYFVSWAIGILLGLKTFRPALWDCPNVVVAAGLFLMTFLMHTTIRGGMEEPGWRGFLLPELQKRFSPLVASLIIAVIWDIWHIPVFINGFYWIGAVEGMARLSLGIIPTAILFTWVYNTSRGNLLVLVLLHTSVIVWSIVPGSFLLAGVIKTIFVIVIVIKDKMYVKPQSNSNKKGNCSK